MFIHRFEQELMRNVIEQTFNIKFQNPVIRPATLPRDPDRIQCRFPWPITIRIWQKMGSTFGSKAILTTICAIRSLTLGDPQYALTT